MEKSFSLLPESASTFAGEVDLLFWYLSAFSAFFSALICALIVVFAVRYRRSRAGAKAVHIEGSVPLELAWTALPLVVALSAFAWGAKVFLDLSRPPEGAMEIAVTGKQWMWKLQHPEGAREINELHVPAGVPIRLRMTSEDVIHSFYVPAFRIKRDVLPGRYSTAWFEATRPGTYHLFCAEYCGTKHSQMIGSVHVLADDDYQRWLAGRPAAATPREAGEKLFAALRCDTCHSASSGARGPDLAGLFGRDVPLADGRVARADEDYLRESILAPAARVVAGFQPLMPTYAGQVGEEQIHELVSYIRSLAAPRGAREDVK